MPWLAGRGLAGLSGGEQGRLTGSRLACGEAGRLRQAERGRLT